MSPHNQDLLAKLMVCFNVVPQTIEHSIETVVILELRGRRAIKLAEAALVR